MISLLNLKLKKSKINLDNDKNKDDIKTDNTVMSKDDKKLNNNIEMLNKKKKDDIAKKEEEIEKANEEIKKYNEEVKKGNEEIEIMRQEIKKKNEEIEKKKKEIEEKKAEIESKKEEHGDEWDIIETKQEKEKDSKIEGVRHGRTLFVWLVVAVGYFALRHLTVFLPVRSSPMTPARSFKSTTA